MPFGSRFSLPGLIGAPLLDLGAIAAGTESRGRRAGQGPGASAVGGVSAAAAAGSERLAASRPKTASGT